MNCRVGSFSVICLVCIQSLLRIFTRQSRTRYLTHQSRLCLSLSLSLSLTHSLTPSLSLSPLSLSPPTPPLPPTLPHLAVCSHRSLLETYGEIYYRAWRLASGPYLKQIEEYCLQDLMYSVVNAPRHGLHSLFHSLRKVHVTVLAPHSLKIFFLRLIFYDCITKIWRFAS